MFEQHLQQAGLTRDQAAMYETLVRNGALPASTVARESNVGRTLSYVVLEQLEKMGLVEKRQDKKLTVFVATHPLKLQELMHKRAEAAEQARASIDGILASLVSEFNKVSGQPGIRILAGVSGLREMYADILRERQPIRLIRSPHDESGTELSGLIGTQIQQQVELGIHARVITVLDPGETPSNIIPVDEKNLVVRRIVPPGVLDTPAQVMIYGNKVALTAYDNPIITTIIENKAIMETFAAQFEYIWETSESEHVRMLQEDQREHYT